TGRSAGAAPVRRDIRATAAPPVRKGSPKGAGSCPYPITSLAAVRCEAGTAPASAPTLPWGATRASRRSRWLPSVIRKRERRLDAAGRRVTGRERLPGGLIDEVPAVALGLFLAFLGRLHAP